MELDRYIRLKELTLILSMSSSNIYRLIKDGKFPKQIKLTERTSVWRLSVIEKWVEDREKANSNTASCYTFYYTPFTSAL
jgi:prophage regulatory protein